MQSERTTVSDQTTTAEQTSLSVRILTWVLTVIAVLAVLAAAFYNFGTMEPPTAEQRADYDAAFARGEVASIESRGFTIPIPGCRCHSDSGVTAMAHAKVPIRDCAKCHGR